MKLRLCKVGDIATVQTGPFGSQLHQRDYTDYGTPIITVEHLGDNRIIHRNTPFVSDDDKERLSRYHLETGDIVFSRVGSVDRRAYVRSEENGWLFSGRCLRVRVFDDEVNSLFLSYYFGLENFKRYVRSIAVGATMPSLNTKIMSNLPLKLPSLDTQNKIANLLANIDEKINLNRKINQVLEKMAQAIFKHWFVDFEFPNENGEPYKSNDGKLVESELGLIPEGWEVVKLTELGEILMGQSPKSSTYNTDNIGMPLLNGASDFNGKLIKPTKYTTDPKRICAKGDLVFCIRATIGNIVYADKEYALGRGVASIKPKKNLYSEIIFCTLNRVMETLISQAAGSVIIGLLKSDIENVTIALPNKSLLIKLHNLLFQLHSKIESNDKQNNTLIKLRDTLLPKLMSGEIRIPDAEKEVEACLQKNS